MAVRRWSAQRSDCWRWPYGAGLICALALWLLALAIRRWPDLCSGALAVGAGRHRRWPLVCLSDGAGLHWRWPRMNIQRPLLLPDTEGEDFDGLDLSSSCARGS